MNPQEVFSMFTKDELKFIDSSNMRSNIEAVIKVSATPQAALESARRFISMVRKPVPQQDSGCESCQ